MIKLKEKQIRNEQKKPCWVVVLVQNNKYQNKKQISTI